jgi:hypothetical protein
MTMRSVQFDMGPDRVLIRVSPGHIEVRLTGEGVVIEGYVPTPCPGNRMVLTPEQLDAWAAALKGLAEKARKRATANAGGDTGGG